MAKYSQKEAVYTAVTSYLTDKGRSLDDVILSSEDRKTIVTMLVRTIEVGDVEMSIEAANKYDTADKIRGYSIGLLSNWLRKDARLNGGKKHKKKNPSIKLGQDDEVIKDLKSIRKLLTQKHEIELVDKEIKNKVESLHREKIVNIVVDTKHIPNHLLHLVKT